MSQLATTAPKQPANPIRALVTNDKVKAQLATALPKFYTPEQFLTIVRTSINRNPKLTECTPDSFMVALLTAGQMGIAPDGRHGHLIPRWNSKLGVSECQFQPDYKGLVTLVRRNDDVADIYADLVCANDTFVIKKGLHRDLVHEIDIRTERGDVLGAYAVIQYKDGTTSFEFMQKQEIDAIRKRSQSANAGPWATDYGEMAKKTVLKRLLKLADLSPDTSERLAVDVESTTLSAVENLPERPKTFVAPVIEDQDLRQLPAPTAEAPAETAKEAPKPESEPEAQPAPADATPVDVEAPQKPAKRRLTKPAAAVEMPAETAPAPEPVKDDSPAGQLRAKLEEAGFTSEDLFRAAIDNRWCEPCDAKTAALETLGDDRLALFLEDWQSVVEEMQRIREARAGK